MQTADENKKNFMSDPTHKQAAPQPSPNDDQADQGSLEPIKGAVSAGAIRCIVGFPKECQDQKCKACDRPLFSEKDRYKLNYEGIPQTVCFVCYLTALKVNPTDSKHREQISGLRSDNLQNLGLQSCTKHPSSHSVSSFTYCASCDLVQCSLCLLASPHRFHQIFPLPAALNTAKKLRDFVVAQIQEQEQAILETSADKRIVDPKNVDAGGFVDAFDRLWAPLAKSLQEKEAAIRAELREMQQSFIEKKLAAEARKQDLISEFKRMKKEFKHLNGLGLLKSTLAVPETSLEKAYQSNRDSFLGKTPSTGYLTPRSGGEPAFQELQEDDTEVVYQRLLKDWRLSSFLGVRSSSLLEQIDAATQQLSQVEAAEHKSLAQRQLQGMEEAVRAVQSLSLGAKPVGPTQTTQAGLHRSRPSRTSRPESTNSTPGLNTAIEITPKPFEESHEPKTSHFLLDILELQHTELTKSSNPLRPSNQPPEVPESHYLSGPKLLSVESPIFLDFKSTPFSRKTGPSFTKLEGHTGTQLPMSNLPQPFFHSHQQQADNHNLPKPLTAPYHFGRPSTQHLASPLHQTLQPRPSPAPPAPLPPPPAILHALSTHNRPVPEQQQPHKADVSKDKAKTQTQPQFAGRPQPSSSPTRGKGVSGSSSQQTAQGKLIDRSAGLLKENKLLDKDCKKDRGREARTLKPPAGK